jgi:hypothetical protein
LQWLKLVRSLHPITRSKTKTTQKPLIVSQTPPQIGPLPLRSRKAIVEDKGLSTYAHNVKIITMNGQITFKGPVKSEEEKQTIASKAAEVAGSPDKVNNQLSIKP